MQLTAGKEDPVELDSSWNLSHICVSVVYGGAPAPMKHPDFARRAAYLIEMNDMSVHLACAFMFFQVLRRISGRSIAVARSRVSRSIVRLCR